MRFDDLLKRLYAGVANEWRLAANRRAKHELDGIQARPAERAIT